MTHPVFTASGLDGLDPPRPPHVVGSLPLVDLANCPATGEGSSQNTEQSQAFGLICGYPKCVQRLHMTSHDEQRLNVDMYLIMIYVWISFYPALCTSDAQVRWTQYTSALEFQATIQDLNDIRGALNHGVFSAYAPVVYVCRQFVFFTWGAQNCPVDNLPSTIKCQPTRGSTSHKFTSLAVTPKVKWFWCITLLALLEPGKDVFFSSSITPQKKQRTIQQRFRIILPAKLWSYSIVYIQLPSGELT